MSNKTRESRPEQKNISQEAAHIAEISECSEPGREREAAAGVQDLSAKGPRRTDTLVADLLRARAELKEELQAERRLRRRYQ